MTTTDLRNYVILPSTPEEAQLCADKLVEMGEDVYQPEASKETFKAWPYFAFYNGRWIRFSNNLHELKNRLVLPAQDFLSGNLPLSKAEYWEQRCRLAEDVVRVAEYPFEDDPDAAKVYQAWQEFKEQNQEPK